MHTKYLALFSIFLAAHGKALPNANDDNGKNKDKNEDHKHKDVKTIETTESNGGPMMTIILAEGGPVWTLATAGQHGEEKTLDDHTYTVVPATSRHPHSASVTPAIETTLSSGSTHVTVISVSNGLPVTLASSGSKESTVETVISGSTYTVEKPAPTPSALGSASKSGSALASPSASVSTDASASAASSSASGSQVPNVAAPRLIVSLESAATSAIISLGILYGALFVL